MKHRKASAVWKGGLKDGDGEVSTESGAIKAVPYGFGMRFGEDPGTNPEELVGAAHAACYAMALSGELGRAGASPDEIRTEATVDFGEQDEGWRITAVHLEVEADVPDADEATFAEAAEKAKTGCPISNALSVEITLDAELVG